MPLQIITFKRGENMANIQIRIDDATKTAADILFNSLGLDTSTAVRMFISSALYHNGLPFEVRKAKPTGNVYEGKFSNEYVAKLQDMWKDPDPTFIEQPEPHFTDRGELFD
jgi:addiction module RelB/DinJ family antitoxin